MENVLVTVGGEAGEPEVASHAGRVDVICVAIWRAGSTGFQKCRFGFVWMNA